MSDLGIVLGIKAGSSIRRIVGALLGGEGNGLIIAHSIVGRRRYTSKALKNLGAEGCKSIEEAISAVEYITSCKVNPITGSLTATYTCSESEARDFFESLSHYLTGEHAQHEKSLIPSSMIGASNRINDEARAAIDNLKQFLNHTEPLFFSRVIGMAFIGYGVYRIVISGDRPSATQVLFWGMGLLLRQSHRDVATENKQD